MKQNKSVLVFNREDQQLSKVSALLKAEDYTVFETSLPLEAIHVLQKNEIDIVLANQAIEGMKGQEFKELAEKIRPGVNVLLIPPAAKEGEADLNLKEFVQFVQNHIRTENRLISEYSRFKEFFFSFADRLLQIFEVNDRYFFNNDHIVAGLSRKVAENMGLEEKLVDAIQVSALLRDIGKIGIQHQLLDEKGKLGREELTLIKSHPVNTVQLLKQVNFPWNVESIIMHHHEHYDGNGYPDGLTGRQIPLGSRIISITDSYAAMTTDRPYRKALPSDDALREIVKKAGTQFDPEIVEAFLSVIREERTRIAGKKRIIVFDPDEALSALIKLNLSTDEFEVLSTVALADFVRHMKEVVPYAVIADSKNIGSNNFHLYHMIRNDVSTQTVPLIAISSDKEISKELNEPLVAFITRPLSIEELSSKLKSFARREQPTPQPQAVGEELKGVAGSLEDLSLVDIIQVLNMGLKTAKVILIKDNKEKGEIYLKDGKIVNVATGTLSGHEAFYELMTWYKGVFKIFHGHKTEEINVTMDTMNLLLEASRVLDESKYKNSTAVNR